MKLAVAELARAIFIAEGTTVYAGRLNPTGFTDILLDELRRYRADRDALILCIPEPEHRRLNDDELRRRERELHSSAELVCLDANGQPIDINNRPSDPGPTDPVMALTAMRRHITSRCDARVLVGGRLRAFQGSMPGVIEEALMSVRATQPVYSAGGFGGAALAVASALGRVDQARFPPNFPEGAEDHAEITSHCARLTNDTPSADDGLSDMDQQQLAASHRPGDISSLSW